MVGGATGRVTIVDDDSAGGGAPQLGLGAATVFEGPSGTATAKIPVTLSAPLAHDVSFNVYSYGGSANWPSDYKRIDKRIRIRAGKVSASVAVPIVGDVETENDEEFFLQIVDVSDQTVSTVAHGSATVIIRDDEPPVPPGNIYSYLFGHPVTLKGPGAPGWVHLAWDEPIGGGSADGYDLELLARQRDLATIGRDGNHHVRPLLWAVQPSVLVPSDTAERRRLGTGLVPRLDRHAGAGASGPARQFHRRARRPVHPGADRLALVRHPTRAVPSRPTASNGASPSGMLAGDLLRRGPHDPARLRPTGHRV